MSKSGTFAKFVYNENGLRVQKIIQPSETDTTNAVVTNYTLHGKNIVHMTQGSNELHFFYDAQNKPAVVVYNGTPYSYVKNLQGDIVAILDSNKNVVVSYVYDAWGRPISKTGSMAGTLGTVQPFRYRGYVYDEETGLYYLRSRFYSAQISRFVNSDIVYCNNLFAYCDNTPIKMMDDSGFMPILCCFSDMGYGNLMVGISFGGMGGAYGGYRGEDSGITSSNETGITGGLTISESDPVEKFGDELRGYWEQWLDNNGIGKLANAGITAASASLAVKTSMAFGAWAGVPGFCISLLVTVPFAFLGGVSGQLVENDLQPDNRFGGEMDQSDPMGIVNNGLVNGVSPIIPSSKDKVVNSVLNQVRKLTKKFVEKILE